MKSQYRHRHIPAMKSWVVERKREGQYLIKWEIIGCYGTENEALQRLANLGE